MKKITLFLFAFFLSWQVNAQFGCGSAVVITNGYTSGPITTPGNGGIEDWSDLPPDSAGATNYYWEDDVYLFKYTAGATPEEISMTTLSVNSWNGLGIFTNCSGTTFSGALAAQGSTNANATKTVTANIGAGQTVYFAIGQWGSPYDLNFSVTNFTAIPLVNPPSCVALSTPANGAPNVSSSMISWPTAAGAATDYKLFVGTSPGATDVLNGVSAGNVLSYDLGGLEAGVTYYVTVVPSNSNGVATGCTETNFTTCDSFSFPFAEEFETITSGVPGCWGIAGTTTTPANHFSSFATGNTGRGLRFNSYANSNGLTSELTTPLIDASTATTMRLTFFYKNPTGGNFEVLVSSDGGATYTSLENNLIGASAWTLKAYNITTHISANVKVKFKGTSNYGSGDAYIYLDGVNIEEIPTVAPTCSTITSPADGATNLMSSKVSWTTSVDAATYYLSVGTAPGGTDVLNLFDVGSVTSYTIPTEPGTTYYVTVYPHNAFGTATGCSEISFTTCDALVPEFLEPFDTFLPSCWSNMQGGDLLTGPTATTGSRWVADGFKNVGTTGAIRAEIWTTGANSWVISPVVSIPAAGYELKFDAAATQYSSTNAPTTAWEADDFIQVLVTTSDIEDWTVLHTYDNTNQPSHTGTSLVINLDAHAGEDVRFAFRAVEGGTNGSADIDFFIDNFEVRLTPSTVPVCATNIVATPDAACGNKPTVISWNSVPGADGYTVSMATTMGGPYTDTNIGNALTYSFVGMIGTTYYYKIVPFNAAGPAVGCAENTFTTVVTGCYCDSVPTSNDNSGITNVQIGTTNFPTTDVTYFNHTATVVDVAQGINNNVQVTFATGYTYNTHIWVDLNDDYNFDASELVYSGESLNGNPTTLNASFVMPASAPLGQHRMRIGTADSGQATPNPCYSGSYGVTLDFMINVIAPSCVPPVATTTVVPDCANYQYSVDINVTSLGSGTPTITDGTTTWPVAAIGVVNVGPFANGSSTTLTLLHGADSVCDIPLGVFKYSCPPVNDECSGAIALTVNTDLNCAVVTPGTIAAATASAVDATACFGTENDDVWFSFVATATTHKIELRDVVGSTTDLYHSLWTGADCTALTLVPGTCSDPNSSTPTGLTIGATYYLRVYSWGSSAQTSTFNVCIGTLPPPPANDECSGAIALTVNPDVSCAVVTAGTISSATASPVSATACGGTENDDVWFSFVATATTHNIQLLDVVGSTTDLFHSLWTGADCSALTLVSGTCSDPNSSTPTGLTIGETYYLRVYSYGTAAQTTNFNVCIGTLPPPPANDECSGALSLTVNADYLCAAVTPGTIASATASAVDTAACGGTENDDVWFSFVATAASHRVELKDVVGSTTDLFHSLWTGDCSALTLVPGTCSDPNVSNPAGLTIGQTYYLRVYSWSAGSKIVNFNVCIGTDPALSANSFDNASFVAYPNPVKDVFNVSYTSEISSVRVLNLLGQEVVSKAVNANSTQIDMSQLSAGTYIVNVTVGDAVKSIKVIKQ